MKGLVDSDFQDFAIIWSFARIYATYAHFSISVMKLGLFPFPSKLDTSESQVFTKAYISETLWNHKKHSIYERQSLDQSIEVVHLTNAYPNDQIAHIRSYCNDLPVTLN